MKKLSCTLTHSSYDIEIHHSLLQKHTFHKQLHSFGENFVIITDDIVKELYGNQLELCLKGSNTLLCSFPEGERSKTRHTKEALEDMMFKKGFGKDTVLIALGGGIVTDIGGYIAATYCRGIPLIMIPTTLLGMVDASIGGKNGVNTPFGKNLIGSIYQPKKVFIDLSTLNTLPQKNIQEGFVEMIKHALIASSSYFEHLEKSPVLMDAIYKSCLIKKAIFEEDEYEQGKRICLNLGHTIAHALEILTNYTITHGGAVAIGILVESKMAVDLGYLPETSLKRIQEIFFKYNIPTQLQQDISPQAIVNLLILDKKTIQKKPRFVLLKDVGDVCFFNGAYCTHVEETYIKKALDWVKT